MSRIPLYYTFGNHMHWVDMEWLWGYHVLPGSIRDMLHFCRETGARGNVNFDGIGYEKLAAEDPEALQELKEAVLAGIIEPVGCSYGQPYGLFHGGESNIRQRIYGARAVRRLLGVWPKTFWEEEFDFFPQLPQMLRGCGFEYASLFFQWTWHTPEVPKEEAPVVWWEGQDGSRLLCATRNKLNLHQWPEDMDATFAEMAANPPSMDAQGPTPLILQWLELMPSPDWMCRSEVLLPKMRELLADERFEIKMATLGEYLRGVGSGMGVAPMVSLDVPPKSDGPDIDIRQGAYLPHWTRSGAAYAITFRLAESLPQKIQQQYAEERDLLRKMHEDGRLTSTALAYEYLRLRTEKVESALDAGHGKCLFNNPECAQIVHSALLHFDGDRYDLIASVVMPNHVHVVVRPRPNHDLEKILHSWKSFTAHELNKWLGESGAVWQAEYYDHLIRDEKDLANQLGYIRANPGKAGLDSWPWLYERQLDHDRDDRGNHGRDTHATDLGPIPVRNYTMDDVWHGMSLGKNGDNMRRNSFSTESTLLAAETLAAIATLLGRPYAQWDVYPTWELEEQWRNLLMAQHHDNDECEGLCGHVGKAQYKTAWEGACDILERQIDRITDEFMEDGDGIWIYNPLGWERSWHVVHRDYQLTVAKIPAFGWSLVPPDAIDANCGGWAVDGSTAKFRRGPLEVDVDLSSATIVHYANEDFPDGIPLEGKPLWTWCGSDKDGKPFSLRGRSHWWDDERVAPTVTGDRLIRLPVEFEGHPEDGFTLKIACEPHHDGIEIELEGEVPRTAPGMGPAFGMRLNIPRAWTRIESDEAYGVSEKRPHHKFLKKYPEGDWMTSPQWFEDVQRPFTSLTFSDFADPESGIGLLIGHNGSRQWFFEDDCSVRHILHAYDPWDEEREDGRLENRFRITAHRGLRLSEKWKQTQEAMRGCSELGVGTARTHVPSTFSALSCDSPNVVPTAFYRETEDYSGKHLENYAGKGMGYPFIVRLVEFDGLGTEATLTISGTVAAAFKTNLLGQTLSSEGHGGGLVELTTDQTKGQSRIKVSMQPYEIATIYVDIVEGRKQTRDLDAKREIWATVHRVED